MQQQTESLKSRVLRYFPGLRSALALAARKAIPVVEKFAAPLAREMRSSGWIWQPGNTHRVLNQLYDNAVDPYNFESRPYEAGKYAHSIRLLSGRTYDLALEIGAAEGVFTELLAPLCESLVAIEVAEAAVVRGKKRLAKFSNVSFIQAALPEEFPEGKFDLIVASDVLYYFPKDVVVDLSQQLAGRLAPNGILFALHYLGNFGWPTDGNEVHEILKRNLTLDVLHEETVNDVGPSKAGYTITIFRKS